MRYSRILFACAVALTLSLGAAAVRADQSTPEPTPAVHSPVPTTPAPSPSPSPSPSPQPSSTGLILGPLTIDGVLSGFTSYTSGINASGSLDAASGQDRASRGDLSNAF